MAIIRLHDIHTHSLLIHHHHQKKKMLFVAMVLFIAAYSCVLFSSAVWTHDRNDEGWKKTVFQAVAFPSVINVIASLQEAAYTGFDEKGHSQSLSHFQSNSQSRSQSLMNVVDADPTTVVDCNLFQAWDSTNGVGLYAGRDYGSGDIIDVSSTVPIHLIRNAAGTILEDYLSRCPTLNNNGTFGPDNTTHGILTTGMFSSPSQIVQSNSPDKSYIHLVTHLFPH